MQVDTILKSKGGAVHTLADNAPVADAVTLLNRHNIGAVVVLTASGAVSGILSERDLIRRLGENPATLLNTPVSACMTTKVITCARDTPVASLMEQMTRHRIRHIPIIEDGALVGIVSIGDVVKGKIEEAEQEASALREYIAT